MNINFAGAHPANYRKGRGGLSPVAVVLHTMAGCMAGTRDWYKNPAAKASAHYGIGFDGAIDQYVSEDDSAYACGAINRPTWPLIGLMGGVNPNRWTINVELEGYPGDPITSAQMISLLWLVRDICGRHPIPMDGDRIVGHYRIDSVNRPECPGPRLDFNRLFIDLKGANKPAVAVDDSVVYGEIIDGHLFAPIRALATLVGRSVAWSEDRHVAVLSASTWPGGQAGDPENPKVCAGSVVLQGRTIDGSTYAPVRGVIEAFGKKVEWDGAKNTARII